MVRHRRRYLVVDEAVVPPARGTVQVQGFIFPLGAGTCLRIRREYVADAGGVYNEATPTLTRCLANGSAWQPAQQVEITPSAARLLLLDTKWKVVKSLYRLGDIPGTLEVFHWANDGVMIADISQDDPYERPAWCGDDVTSDGRFADEALAVRPYSGWGEAGPGAPIKSILQQKSIKRWSISMNRTSANGGARQDD